MQTYMVYKRSMDSPLRRYRVENNVTLSVLAAKAGIGETHLSRLERGKAGVSLSKAIKLAEVTGLPIEEIARQ